MSFGNSIAVIPSGSKNNGSQLPVVFITGGFRFASTTG
jgi:hypothetical protein